MRSKEGRLDLDQPSEFFDGSFVLTCIEAIFRAQLSP